jgi:hypothetical protein
MLQNYAHAASSFNDLMNDAFLQEGQTTSTVSLATKKNKDGAAGLVVGLVEPIPQVEAAVAMGLVSCLIVEEIDRYREVTFWVKGFQIHLVGTLAERALLCRGNLNLSAIVQFSHPSRQMGLSSLFSFHIKRRLTWEHGYCGHGSFERTALSISCTVRGTAFSAAASRPNSNPRTAVENRMLTALDRGGS